MHRQETSFASQLAKDDDAKLAAGKKTKKHTKTNSHLPAYLSITYIGYS
jgi:hypothetical protein